MVKLGLLPGLMVLLVLMLGVELLISSLLEDYWVDVSAFLPSFVAGFTFLTASADFLVEEFTISSSSTSMTAVTTFLVPLAYL